MKNMAFEAVGDLFVVVHNENPPRDEEWNAYVAAGEARAFSGRGRFLVFTQGGGPTSLQRRHLFEQLKGVPVRTAVVSGNAFIRSVVIALSVFNRAVKVFKPSAINDAYVYLGISDRERDKVAKVLRKLQGELGIAA